MMKSVFDLSTPMSLEKTIAVYEYCRPLMPGLKHKDHSPQKAERLRDLLPQFDALLLDGYGVLNVGAEVVPQAQEMITQAQEQGIITMVLTNGASKDKKTASQKYQQLGLSLDPSLIISSRDALLWQLENHGQDLSRLGVVDSFTDLPLGLDMDAVALTPHSPQDWLVCDAIGFFGAVHWDQNWQNMLEAAIKAEIPIMVANPDVTAPHQGGFSREPGFWVAKAVHDLGLNLEEAPAKVNISWFGKPHGAVYDLALKRLEETSGRTSLKRNRIAMVGDTLHTDILGGHAAGLSTVLITGHGLFRQGNVEETMKKTGIIPDYMTVTV